MAQLRKVGTIGLEIYNSVNSTRPEDPSKSCSANISIVSNSALRMYWTGLHHLGHSTTTTGP